jgi:heat shock protein HtpX
MAVAKRVSLFILTNILILVTITITMRLLGLEPYLTGYGIDYTSLAIFALLWGMGGAMISLAMSRKIAKWTMGVKVIPESTSDPALRELVNTVHNLSRAAGLPKMPEVGIYSSPEVNAFATGPSKARSLVAVSSGMLQRMDRREVEGVLGHEVAHIANGDMVTMTLLQGVINAFVLFFSRILAFVIVQALRGRDERGGWGLQFMLTIVLQILLSILGAMVVAAFSRWREFRADAGSARLTGSGSMIAALEALRRNTQRVDTHQQAFVSLKISGTMRRGLAVLLASHPPLDARIERLRRAA